MTASPEVPYDGAATAGRPLPPTTRGQRTRHALIVGARAVFERDGYTASRISDIAEAARVSHGTFYTYFDSKLEIFIALAVELRAELLASGEVRAAEAGGPVDRIRRANRAYLEVYRRNSRLMLAYEQVAAVEPEVATLQLESSRAFTERTTRLIRRLQAAGLTDDTVDPLYVAAALTAMVSRFCQGWAIGYHDFDMDTAVDQLTQVWARTLGLDGHR